MIRTSRRHRRVRRWVLAIVGAVAGVAAAPSVVGHLSSPQALDPARWTVIVPGLDEQIGDVARADGTGRVDGTLTIAVRAFGRRDTLVPRDPRAVGALEVDLAPWSGPVAVTVRDERGGAWHPVVFAPGAVRGPRDAGFSTAAGPLRVEFRAGGAWVGGREVERGEPGVVELAVEGETAAAVRRLRYEDTDGGVILDERFDAPEPGWAMRLGVAVVGAAVGLAVGTAPVAALLLVFPGIVLWEPFPAWLALAERLLLVDRPAGDLRLLAMGLALLPVLGAGLLSSRVLELPEQGRAVPGWIAAVICVLVAAVASREQSGWGWLATVPGLGLLGLPAWTASRAGQPLARVLLRDAPALGLVGALGWGLGLLPALCWRLLCLGADAGWFNRVNPRAGADALVVTVLALPVAAEAAIRATTLPVAWERAHTDSAAGEMAAFWEGRCGEGGAVYWFGGSSLGGAYQFREEPEAFFPARVHAALCARGGAISLNYGDSGRDSWDAARAVDGLYGRLPPAVTVLYVGVNDLLTVDHPLTRKQRAAAGLAARRRSPFEVVNALALLARPVAGAHELVPAVPLADAEENLRAIAAATTAAGGHLLLVPEYAQPEVAASLAPYREMEARVAASVEGVTYVDLYGALAGGSSEALLADRNHLSRHGSERVAEVLLPEVARWIEPGTPPPK